MDKQVRELNMNSIIAAIKKTKAGSKFMFRVGTVSYYIKCTTTMKVVSKNLQCAVCGARATHAILCINKEGNYYVAFYTERNGELVLFTKDHIIPRANGGSDSISNLQSCCEVCNKAKGNAEIGEKEICEIVNLKNKLNRLRAQHTSLQDAHQRGLQREGELMAELRFFRRYWLFRLLERHYIKHKGKWLL